MWVPIVSRMLSFEQQIPSHPLPAPPFRPCYPTWSKRRTKACLQCKIKPNQTNGDLFGDYNHCVGFHLSTKCGSFSFVTVLLKVPGTLTFPNPPASHSTLHLHLSTPSILSEPEGLGSGHHGRVERSGRTHSWCQSRSLPAPSLLLTNTHQLSHWVVQ